MPRTSPSELTISVTTRPQPPCRLTRRRNAVSVMPAIGATANGDCSSTLPMRIWTSVARRHRPGVKNEGRGSALTRRGQMNQVVVGALVEPHAPILTLFEHLYTCSARRKAGALDHALDVGVAHDRGK